jgi:hypothetical protein
MQTLLRRLAVFFVFLGLPLMATIRIVIYFLHPNLVSMTSFRNGLKRACASYMKAAKHSWPLMPLVTIW